MKSLLLQIALFVLFSVVAAQWNGSRRDSINTNRPNNFGPAPSRGKWDNTWNVEGRYGRRGEQSIRGELGKEYTSKNGNWNTRIGAYGDVGKGRKPDYGVSVGVQGRFRRDVDTEEESVMREKRSPFREGERRFPNPGQNQNDKGGWSVTSNQDKGRGPQIRVEADKNIYDNGKTRVDAGGHWEAGRGRKPDHGVWIKGGGRWRRDVLEDELFDEEDITEVEENNGRMKRSPFREGERRFPNPGQNQNDKGGWSVTSNRDKGRGPQIRVEADRNIYDNGKTRVDAGGHWEAGRGRKPDHGVWIKGGGRWRRDVSAALEEEFEDEELVRLRRRANEHKPKVTIYSEKRGPQRPTSNVQVEHKLWESPKRDQSIKFKQESQFGNGKPKHKAGLWYEKSF